MMGTHAGSVITLANSIIGVSVLAMPFCFKQCGIVLAILMLLLSSIVSRLACHYLIKSAIMEKRRNFEMLAFRAFGPTGKLMVELCIIGFMLGTCVAFFVVVGDLGPAIMAPLFGFEHPTALRPSVLIALGIFVVLPLGLLRNVDSLSTLSAASIAFYTCLVFKVMGEATTHLLSGDWVDKVYYWRPSGLLQCIPIFSMALSCQTQLFEIFESVHTTPLDRMNSVVRSAINMTTTFYIAVGFFGYVAYCHQTFSGNLMLSFSPTLTSNVIKLGFVLSVAVSFPLVIFPCRASIYSLLFSKGHMQQHELSGSAHIPETKFQCITLVIITSSLVVGLLIPNIELVLGIVGSTIGVFICLVFPAVIFVTLTNRNTNERLLAKVLVGTGLVIMVLGTYTNLNITNEAIAHSHNDHPMPHDKHSDPLALNVQMPKLPEKVVIKDETLKELKDVKELAALPELRQDNLAIPKESKKMKEEKPAQSKVVENKVEEPKSNGRQEPPVPVEQEMKKVVSEEDKRKLEQKLEKNKEEEKRVLEELRKKEEEKRALEELMRKKEEEKRVMEELRKKDEEKKALEESRKKDEEKRALEESRKKEEEKRALEESRKKEEEEKKVAEPLKVMDVKTGQLSDIKKLDPLKSENDVLSQKEELPEMKKPLELAPRNLTDPLVAEGKKAPENTSFKEQMLKGIPLPVVASNLLKIEERGKRDLEEVEKLDQVSEECPQNETKAEAEPLIKSPVYLSDPKPILDSEAPKLEPPLLGGPVPRKRDLKSVQPQKKSSEDHK